MAKVKSQNTSMLKYFKPGDLVIKCKNSSSTFSWDTYLNKTKSSPLDNLVKSNSDTSENTPVGSLQKAANCENTEPNQTDCKHNSAICDVLTHTEDCSWKDKLDWTSISQDFQLVDSTAKHMYEHMHCHHHTGGHSGVPKALESEHHHHTGSHSGVPKALESELEAHARHPVFTNVDNVTDPEAIDSEEEELLDVNFIEPVSIFTTENCDKQLHAIVQKVPMMNTDGDIFNPFISNFRITVKHKDRVIFYEHHKCSVPPAVGFHPKIPHILTIMTVLTDDAGSALTSYNVTSGQVIWSRDCRTVEADGDSVVTLMYNNTGSYITLCILEQMGNNRQYLTRLFILEVNTLNIVSKSKPSLIRTCHEECITNIQPVFSKCGSYTAVPSTKANQSLIHRMPVEKTLKEAARTVVLQTLPGDSNRVIPSLEIPENLKLFLRFEY